MSTQCNAGRGAGMSNITQAAHQTRSAVLVYALERAREERGVTYDEFAEQLAVAYEAEVPEHKRLLKIRVPRATEHKAWRKELNALVTRTKRYIAAVMANVGDEDDERAATAQPLHIDLEEPWCSALDAVAPGLDGRPGYGEQARQSLARRHGFLAAHRPDAPEAGTDCNLLTDISNGSSQAMRLVVQALADGRLDEHDLEQAPALVAALDDLASKAIAARARVIERTGLVTTELSVVGGRERSS